jgi:hypothetical protein
MDRRTRFQAPRIGRAGTVCVSPFRIRPEPGGSGTLCLTALDLGMPGASNRGGGHVT